MIVKVCGVSTAAMATAALDAGADWIGIVLERRSPRHVDAWRAREVGDAVRGRGTLVGVMVSPTPAECEEAASAYRLDAVQAHGTLDPDLVTASVPVIPGINPPPGTALLTDQWWPDCLLLLDAWPGGDAALPGGTGTQVNRRSAAALARHRPLILAGGLHAGNVADAIAVVRPRGVDASSGLESAPGVKDVARVVAFVTAAREAAATVAGTTP